MTAKKSYNRFFIIFQEEDKGYGIGPGRQPTGYVKMETKSDKGKVTVYVQNLKPFENAECLYKCYLISHKDDKDSFAYLGIMNIDELGRGETSWETGADNAFDSKISMDKFNGAAILVEREGMSSVVAPLAGYMSKDKFDWRGKISIVKQKNTEVEKVEVKVEAEETVEESAKFDGYETQIAQMVSSELEAADVPRGAVEEKVEAPAEPDTREVVEAIAEVPGEAVEENVKAPEVLETREVPEETEQVEAVVLDNDEDEEARGKHKHYEECPCHDMHEHKGHDDDEHYKKSKLHPDCRRMMAKTLEDILEDYEEIDVHKEMPDYRMWKIDMKRYKRDMKKIYAHPGYDLIFYLMMDNPYCNYYSYIRRYGYFLFGIEYGKEKKMRQANRAVRRLTYGIPGLQSIIEQPFQGMTGFLDYLPAYETTAPGYWLMKYDPMTGIVSQR